MARNPKNHAGQVPGVTAAAAGATISLADVQKNIDAANAQRTESIATLQAQRASHVSSIGEIDALLNGLGVETDTTPARGRRGRPRGPAKGSGGGKGSRGPRDPLGLKGYIARSLIRAGTNGMQATDLTTQVLKDGWKNDSPTFNTQVYQVAGKMVKEGVIRNPGRGLYAMNAKTQKFLEGIQDAAKEKAKAAA